MPVVNDVPGLYERITAYATQLAQQLNVPKEAVFGYFNETAHFPQSPQELADWGNQTTKYGVSRRDPATGAWRPIMPGVNPDPRLSQLDRGGFPHQITNAEDSQIERFQQVGQNGLPFGGSWDNRYNLAHPELAGKSGFDTPIGQGLGFGTAPPGAQTQQAAGGARSAAGGERQQLMGTMSAQARPFDQNNYVAPNPGGIGYHSVVDGVVMNFGTQQQAEDDYNQRTGGDQGTGASGAAASGSAAPGAASPGAGGGSAGGSSGGTVYIPPDLLSAANTAGNNAGMLAYYNARLALDRDTETHRTEEQKQQIALQAARDA